MAMIEKPGKASFRTECLVCTCVFRYNYEDLADITGEVSCPQCGKLNEHRATNLVTETKRQILND